MKNNFLGLFSMKILYTYIQWKIFKVSSIFSTITHNTIKKTKNI